MFSVSLFEDNPMLKAGVGTAEQQGGDTAAAAGLERGAEAAAAKYIRDTSPGIEEKEAYTDLEANQSPQLLDTNAEEAAAVEAVLTVGRPDLQRELRSLAGGDGNHKTLLFVCGPPGLAVCCQEFAYREGWAFHTELFAL